MGLVFRVTQGHCPKCGSDDINYGLSEVQDESIFYESDCNECESKFHEHYTLKFSGMSLFLEQNEVKEMDAGDTILNDRKQQEEKA